MAPNFALLPENEFVDPDITEFGTANTVVVTEAAVLGWALTSITCAEVSGNGSPNSQNTTIDLSNRKVNIVVEEGEQVECTFTSQQLAPTASRALVQGGVYSERGQAVRGITMTLLDLNTGQSRSATTNSFGIFSFADLPVGHPYTLTAGSTKRYDVVDETRAFTLNEDLLGIDFIAIRR